MTRNLSRLALAPVGCRTWGDNYTAHELVGSQTVRRTCRHIKSNARKPVLTTYERCLRCPARQLRDSQSGTGHALVLVTASRCRLLFLTQVYPSVNGEVRIDRILRLIGWAEMRAIRFSRLSIIHHRNKCGSTHHARRWPFIASDSMSRPEVVLKQQVLTLTCRTLGVLSPIGYRFC